jgi:hypothetical protein
MFSPDTAPAPVPTAGEAELFERVMGASRRLRRRRLATRATGSSLALVLVVAAATGLMARNGPTVRVDSHVADDGGTGTGGADNTGPSAGEDPDDPPDYPVIDAPEVEERAPGVIPKLPTRGRTQPPNTAGPSGGPRLVFSRTDPNNWTQIWTMAPDGSSPRQLTSDLSMHFYPAWSPNGDHIAYAQSRSINEPVSVRVLSADGSSDTNLITLPGQFVHDLEWSPDGSQVAYVADDSALPGPGTLWVIAAAGGTPRQVLDGVVSFDWSPNGSQLAVEVDGAIEVVGTDGSGPRRVGPGAWPDWSPDGRSFAYVDGGRIAVMGVDGTGAHALTDPGSLRDTEPSWLGSGIVFERGDNNMASCWPVGATPCNHEGALWQVGSDGSGAHHVGKGDHDFSPDAIG